MVDLVANKKRTLYLWVDLQGKAKRIIRAIGGTLENGRAGFVLLEKDDFMIKFKCFGVELNLSSEWAKSLNEGSIRCLRIIRNLDGTITASPFKEYFFNSMGNIDKNFRFEESGRLLDTIEIDTLKMISSDQRALFPF